MTTATKPSRHGHRDTILVVDADVRAQRLMRTTLEPLGYQMVTADMAHEVTEVIETYEPALILLEVQLPDTDGFEVCQRIRATSAVPLIFLTARSHVSDILRGFDVGADDYITKPYDPLEVTARIGAVLRRMQGASVKRQALFRCGPLTIDFDQRLVAVDGQEVALSRTEYRLLEYLALNAGRTLVADAILSKVWGVEYMADYASLHLYISRLRRKLGEGAGNTRFIVTKPGIGYMMPTADTCESPRLVSTSRVRSTRV